MDEPVLKRTSRKTVGFDPTLLQEGLTRTTQQLSITLPDEMADLVRAKFATGEYATESEVKREGLRTLLARDRAVEGWLREQVAPAYDTLKPICCVQSPRTMYEPRSRPNTRRPPKNADVLHGYFHARGVAQLTELYSYIAAASSPEVAARYTDSIVTYCESLQSLLHRGIQRDDIRPSLRITSYRKRVVIAFEVDADRVAILGAFYGGQDYETSFQEEKDEEG